MPSVGAIGVSVRDCQIQVFKAKAVVMCGGGLSFPYPRMGLPFNSMPVDASGDGQAALLRAGAVVGNWAMGATQYHAIEFHTAPGLEHFSAQGVTWVNRLGEHFMEKHVEGEKSFTRRHTLGAAMAVEVQAGRGPVFLDSRHFTPDQFRFLWDVIPIIMSNWERAGYNLSKDLIPYFQTVAGVHGRAYNAGAVIDEECRTSIPGLFAAGASSDGMNVKVGLTLTECFVTGLWAGEHAARYAKESEFGEINKDQVSRLADRIQAPLHLSDGIKFEEAHEKLERMFLDLGSILNAMKLEKALRSVEGFIEQDSDRITARDAHYLVKVLSLKNAAQVARVIVLHLLHRKESRGSVLNEDYPEMDNDNWLTWTRSVLGNDNKIEVWDDPIPEETYVHRRPSKGKKPHPVFEALRRFGSGNSH